MILGRRFSGERWQTLFSLYCWASFLSVYLSVCLPACLVCLPVCLRVVDCSAVCLFYRRLGLKSALKDGVTAKHLNGHGDGPDGMYHFMHMQEPPKVDENLKDGITTTEVSTPSPPNFSFFIRHAAVGKKSFSLEFLPKKMYRMYIQKQFEISSLKIAGVFSFCLLCWTNIYSITREKRKEVKKWFCRSLKSNPQLRVSQPSPSLYKYWIPKTLQNFKSQKGSGVFSFGTKMYEVY